MDKRETILCIAATAMLAVFMAMAPARIIAAREPLTLIYRTDNAAEYHGIINVWHIAGFKPYQGSMTNWLSARALELEKQHDGVYFEVLSMSVEESEIRISRGERPHIYSFPSGWAYAEQLKELELHTEPLRGTLAKSSLQDGRCFAMPYAVSGYLLLTNDRRLQEAGLQSTDAPEAMKNGSLKISGNAVQGMLNGAYGTAAPEDTFKEGNADAGYFDARFAGDAKRRLDNGRGFTFGALPVEGNTDLVQYFAIDRNIDSDRLAYAVEFIENAMEAEQQETLYELGLTPARSDVAAYDGDEAHIKLLCDGLKEPVVPNTFLYNTYKAALEESALAALAGDENAKKDFRLRWIELVEEDGIK